MNHNSIKNPKILPADKPTRGAISIMEELFKIEPGIVRNISKFHNNKYNKDLEIMIHYEVLKKGLRY